MRTLMVLAAFLLLAACDKSETNNPDGTPPGGDGPVITDTGVPSEGSVPGDNGVPSEGSVPGDTGVPSEGSVPGDNGVPSDNGAPVACDPNFGQAEACGGTLGGTKWKYTGGCVADAAWDALKTNCPGATVSNVAVSVGTNNSLHFFNNGTLMRTFSGSISGKAFFPQACTKLGCVTLQAALKLALATHPGSTVTCAAASAGGCDCDVSIALFAFNGGTWVANGGTVTVTAANNTYPYYYCISGNTLTYHGTPQNTDDQNVTYVLQTMP